MAPKFLRTTWSLKKFLIIFFTYGPQDFQFLIFYRMVMALVKNSGLAQSSLICGRSTHNYTLFPLIFFFSFPRSSPFLQRSNVDNLHRCSMLPMLHHAGIKNQTLSDLVRAFRYAEICGNLRWSSRRRAATSGSVSSATRSNRCRGSSLADISPKTSVNSFRPSTHQGNSNPGSHRFRPRRRFKINKSQSRNFPNQEREAIGLSIWTPPKKRKEEEEKKVSVDWARKFWVLVIRIVGFLWVLFEFRFQGLF